jgi:hypothetical protein
MAALPLKADDAEKLNDVLLFPLATVANGGT